MNLKIKKNMKYKILIPVILSCFLLAENSNAQIYQKSKKIIKSYGIKSDCSVQIINKYGNIHIIPWEKDSVRFEISMTIKSKKKEKIENIMNSINIDFTNTQYYVIAKTSFIDYMNTFWADFSKMTNIAFSSGNSVEINYVVYVPIKCELKIDNKYGNIYTTDVKRDLSITLSNGDFKAHNLYGNSKINVDFGNVTIENMNIGRLSINYSEFELKNAKNLDFISKSSKININKIGIINIDSKRDKYYINTVKTMKGEAYFSYITIYNFYKNILLRTKYGNVNLETISDKFQYIQINSEYTDFNFFFNTTASYILEIKHNYKTKIIFPINESSVEKDIISKEEKTFNSHAIIGRNKQTLSKLKMNMNSGTINIIHK